jgi:hypothetical protein
MGGPRVVVESPAERKISSSWAFNISFSSSEFAKAHFCQYANNFTGESSAATAADQLHADIHCSRIDTFSVHCWLWFTSDQRCSQFDRSLARCTTQPFETWGHV